jgi:UDP-N-acetylmuramoyl-tripeptide--D-alanyl-D-alanine ligase
VIFIYPSRQTALILLIVTIVFYLIGSVILYKSRKVFVKKPLVITPRAWRLIITSTLLSTLLFVTVGYLLLNHRAYQAIGVVFAYILFNLFIYLVVLIASIINLPIEKYIQWTFIRDAQAKITALKNQLTVVGITGSYGKTTTKNIVYHVLHEKFYPLMTPASFNTPMGITRTIHELLKPIHNIFIMEMGAYKRGEIKELTEIAQPQYGILTGIGPQHLNTFKTIENIQQTKFELIESLGKDGTAILNYDDPLIRSYTIQNKCKVITYGIEQKSVDYRATKIAFDASGIRFTLVMPNKKQVPIVLPILGEHNVLNALASIALGLELGESIEQIQHGLQTVPQIQHRLELKSAGTYTIIDDAFNANPVGTKKAVDVLEKMDGKRIVLTPGMIELGPEEERLNYEYGVYMADKIDVAILVGAKQTVPIFKGLATKMDKNQIYVVKNLTEGLEKMRAEATAGSFVLIANDLPDSYNE